MSPTETDPKLAPGSAQSPQAESVLVAALLGRLCDAPVSPAVETSGLGSLEPLEVMHLAVGDQIVQEAHERHFMVMLEGEVKVHVEDKLVGPLTFKKGESFGEIPILANKTVRYVCSAQAPSVLVRFTEEKFWKLMFACPGVRQEILGNMARRLEAYQLQEVRREKMSALGALAAGLMHELKNPGTAAIRAASQMRENLVRLQQLTLRLSQMKHNDDQKECLSHLQQLALGAVCCKAMSSLEQSDAEEAMESRLEEVGVENGWRVASTLVAMGMTTGELECASAAFAGGELSVSLNWLESLVSSVQLVGTIEESLGRVHELIMAVKHYSYDDDTAEKTVNVHDSIQSTLLILGHKLRQKQLTMERHFAKDLPPIRVRAGGLNQVWTNLLDNAIDAAPDKSVVRVSTWQEGESIFVAVEDHGGGIAETDAGHVFEPFYTTKPVGEGTGLGLDIVHRILAKKMGGSVTFASKPGRTVFTVQLPIDVNKDVAVGSAPTA